MCIVNLLVVCGTTWPERYETLKELIGITLNIIIIWTFVVIWSGNAALYMYSINIENYASQDFLSSDNLHSSL